jgi:hypothetical protein
MMKRPSRLFYIPSLSRSFSSLFILLDRKSSETGLKIGCAAIDGMCEVHDDGLESAGHQSRIPLCSSIRPRCKEHLIHASEENREIFA